MPNEPTEQQKKSLTVEILEQMSKLATTGFGLVAALAWNDAIQNLFKALFPQPGGEIYARFIYAILITAIIVIVTLKLGDLVNKAKEKLTK